LQQPKPVSPAARSISCIIKSWHLMLVHTPEW
jgi:hypothetical protein